MMMETIAAVIPHDVYSYVHACDDGVDVSVDTSTEGDFSPDSHSENSQYCLEQRALVAGLHNGTAEPDQQAFCSLGYQDLNAAGDIEQTPDATAHEGSSEEAAFPEENVIFYTEDHQPCVWDATLNAYVLVDPDSITNHVPHQEATDGEPVEAVELEAGVEYTEAFAGGEPETVYADPTQMHGQENVPAESAQEHGYQDEYGNFVYYEQAPLEGETETGYSDPTQVQGEENGFVPAQSTEVQGNYEENADIVYNEQAPEGNEEAQYDPAQYAEEQPVEGNVYLGADGVQNAQVESYAEEEYTGAYAVAENSGALFLPEAIEPVPDTQVPELSPETASAELAYTPEEHQRDLDAAFFCVEGGYQPPPQVTEGFTVQGSQDLAQAHADQSQPEVQAAEEAMSTIGTAEYIEQEVAQEQAYDPSASAPAVCSQEPCADQAALTGYHGEVAQGYGAEAVEFHGGEASQAYCAGASFGDYQEQSELEPQQYSEQVDGEQYQHYEQAEATAEYAPQHFAAESVVHEETYAQPFEEADCTANAAYPAEEAVYHYETATAATPLDAELVQDQIDAHAQLEYVEGAEQYCEQQPVVTDGVVYHAAYGGGVDPSQLGYDEEQQFLAENTEQHDFGVYEVEGVTLADQTYDPAAIDVQQYSEVLGEVSAGEGDTQAAQSLAEQELISEAGTATQVTDQGYVDNHVAEQQHVPGVEPYTEGHEQQSALEYTEQDLQESSEQYPGEGVEQYSLLQEQQYSQEYPVQDPEERYAAEGAEHNSADHVEQFPQEYAVQDASAYQDSQECAEQHAPEYAAQYPAECIGQYPESQAYIEAGDFSQQNGGLPLGHPTEAYSVEVCASRNEVVSPHIVRGKPFTREMDSTEKFKNFRIEYERTPAFDAFGHCLRFLGVRRGFVCSIRADGVVCIQLKGSQQDEWQDTEFEYDASKPAAKVEVGNMYVIEHSFDGNKYLERCRVTNVENGIASIHLLDTGCERDIPENQLHDIVNLEEVERLPPQVVEIFVVGLTNEGYSKEDLERLENDWNSYEEVFIIPVDAPKDGLIRTIVSRKNGETLGIRTPPQNMNKIV